MPPKLSFCLPTANRAEDLARCFWSVYSAALDIGVLDQIEICVADNCSTDTTPQICETWRARFPHFQYTRQETKRDFVTNLETVCALATGDYLWLFGDDDCLFYGVLGLVLETCARQPDMIHAAAITFSRCGTGANYIGVAEPREVAASALFADEIVQNAYGYITCLIFRRDVWTKSGRVAERHRREVTTHVQLVGDCLAGGNCLAIHTPCVLIDKTPARTAAAVNGYWAIVLGYEMFKARARNFPAGPGGRGGARYYITGFVQSFGVLSLMREHYGGIYELAAKVPAQDPLEKMCKTALQMVFEPKIVRNAAIRVLGMLSPRFRQRMDFLDNLTAQEKGSSQAQNI